MKKAFLIALIALGVILSGYTQTKDKKKLKQVEYRVCVIADKPGVDYFGGKKAFQKKLKGLFNDVTDFWNNASDEFEYYFKFTPTLHAVFEGSSKDVLKTYGGDDFDFRKYDVLVMFDMLKDHDDEHPGAAAGGVKNGLCGIYVRNGDTLKMKEIFTDGTYKTVAHELGHYRMVTDIYATQVRAHKNPVTDEAFIPVPCIMHNASRDGVWCPYAMKIINYCAESRVPANDYPDFFRSMFPDSIQFNITEKGQPKEGIVLNLYGCRAKHNDVIKPAYRTYKSNSEGKIILTEVKDMYCNPPQPERPDNLPYGRWFNFLVEAIDGNTRKYYWMPEYEVQLMFFENKNIYEMNIDF